VFQSIFFDRHYNYNDFLKKYFESQHVSCNNISIALTINILNDCNMPVAMTFNVLESHWEYTKITTIAINSFSIIDF
jgi:hypothetical protein